jgi:restriction system protein
MAPNPRLSTSTAFDALDDEIEVRLAKLQAEIADAAKRGGFDRVGELAKAAQELAHLRKDLQGFEKRFGHLVEVEEEPAGEGARIHKGLKTPQEAYQAPILQALVELGGRSNLNPVLDRVYALMKGRLNDYDLTPLASDGVTPRWRNTAQWARNDLWEQGLIREDTPRSIWEITEKGRQWLREHVETAAGG